MLEAECPLPCHGARGYYPEPDWPAHPSIFPSSSLNEIRLALYYNVGKMSQRSGRRFRGAKPQAREQVRS